MQQDVADCACAGDLCLHRDERPRQTLGQNLLILGGLVVGIDETPPRDLLVLTQPPFLARGQDLVHPLGKELRFVRRDAGVDVSDFPDRLNPGLKCFGELGRRDDRFGVLLSHLDLRRRYEVVYNVTRRERNASHGVWQVLVEAGKEPEAMFAGQISSSACAGPRSAHAPSFPAPVVWALLVDFDLKPAFD